MKKRPASIIRRFFAILLVVPVGYTFLKPNLPNPTFTKLDEILRYIFPILFALAYLNDNLDRSESAQAKAKGVSPGGDIMIHGLPNGIGFIGKLHTKRDWTLGCIAVTNSEIEEIWHAVPDGATVEIVH